MINELRDNLAMYAFKRRIPCVLCHMMFYFRDLVRGRERSKRVGDYMLHGNKATHRSAQHLLLVSQK